MEMFDRWLADDHDHLMFFFISNSKNLILQVFAAAGYRCIAIDLSGCGKTGGPAVPDNEKAEILSLVIRRLELGSVSHQSSVCFFFS